MNYPLISEYVESIKSAEDNFDALNQLRPVKDASGTPVMSSGNFAVVFKMKDEQTGKLYAVKCFTKDQEHRTESYRLIAEELKQVDSEYLTSLQYLENELFVDSGQTSQTEFPVVLMDWVEGKTLDKYLREHLDDEYELEMLAYRFSQLAQWIISQPFAHGDLKPDNILVREDGILVLVDYDGMYVPAMQGQKARELGSPDFRHPLRTENDFDEHIDDFPLVSILLSLKAIAVKPSLLGQHGASDRLLFSENDYRNIGQCEFIKNMISSTNEDMNKLVGLFLVTLSEKTLTTVSLNLLSVHINHFYSSEVLDGEYDNAWKDEYGVDYTFDRKKLLDGSIFIYDSELEKPETLSHYEKEYRIKIGTVTICDKAFSPRFFMDGIFVNRYEEYEYEEPRGVSSMDFQREREDAKNKEQEVIHKEKSDNSYNNVAELLESLFDNGFYCCLQKVYIPETVVCIGDFAFAGCSTLTSINIPKSITKIGEGAFDGCRSLTSIIIPKGSREKFEKMLPRYKDKLVEE